MAEFKVSKVVSQLPEELESDTLYFVRRGGGFDIRLTNGVGEIVAYSLNIDLNPPVHHVGPGEHIVTEEDTGGYLVVEEGETELVLEQMPSGSAITVICSEGATANIGDLMLEGGHWGIAVRDMYGKLHSTSLQAVAGEEGIPPIPVAPAILSIFAPLNTYPGVTTEEVAILDVRTSMAVVGQLSSDEKYMIASIAGGTVRTGDADYSVLPQEALLNDRGWGEVYLDITQPELIKPWLTGRILEAKSKGYSGVVFTKIENYHWDDVGKEVTLQDILDFTDFTRLTIEENGMTAVLDMYSNNSTWGVPRYQAALARRLFEYGSESRILDWTSAGRIVWAAEVDDITAVCPTIDSIPTLFVTQHDDSDVLYPPVAACYV